MSDNRQTDWTRSLRTAIRRGNVLLTILIYLAFAPVGYVALTALSFAWRKDVARRAHRLQRITSSAYRFSHRWLSWLRIARFDHQTPLPGLPSGPCVVIANHPTRMDITAILAALGGGTTVVKSALIRRPMIRPLLVGAGYVEGPSADPLSAGRVVDEVVQRLSWGLPAVIFPEGTRSPHGKLLRFGRLAFEVACRAELPLVSVVVTCDPIYLSKRVSLFAAVDSTPELRLAVLAVDQPADDQLDSRALRHRVEERYRAWLRDLASSQNAPYASASGSSACQISLKTG